MTPGYVIKRFKVGDTVRITTDAAVGVIGRITDIDSNYDGIELEGFKEKELLDQIDNAISFDKAAFSISDIKYIFKITLQETKPINQNGINGS